MLSIFSNSGVELSGEHGGTQFPSSLGLTPAAIVLLSTLAAPAAMAQGQSGFDPRQAERQFDAQQSDQRRNVPSPLRIARPHWDKSTADGKPLFGLRHVALTGVTAMPAADLAPAYHSYLGKKVSQADLAKIAEALSDRYRAAGYHLSRAIVPPQDVNAGRIQVKVIEGAITDLVLKGDNLDVFGIRALLDPVLAERPAKLATLERQLLLINDLPGARVADTAIEEIGVATGKFRLIVQVKTWGFTPRSASTISVPDRLGHGRATVRWRSTPTFSRRHADGERLDGADRPSELAFGRLSYDAPVGIDGARVGATALYSDVRPGDYRRQFDTRTQTETFELRAASSR